MSSTSGLDVQKGKDERNWFDFHTGVLISRQKTSKLLLSFAFPVFTQAADDDCWSLFCRAICVYSHTRTRTHTIDLLAI